MNRQSGVRVHFALGILLAALAVHEAAAAQYPTRPVRLVVPFAAGGGADTLSRIIAPKLSDALGQTWVVDNRGGAAGNLAAEIVADAAPDGHTVFMGFSTVLTVNPSLYKLRWNVERSFQPVALLATAQYLLVVHPSVKAGSLKEFIALARQRAGSLNYASAGVGSPLHLAAELFKKRASVDMVHLPYKGGGPAAAAVLAGEAQVIFGSVASSMPHVKAGKLRALATTGSKRSKVAPDLPTIAESGFPGFDVSSWYAFLVPAKTSAPVVNRLRDEAIKAVALPDVQQAMARQGLEVETGTPQQLAQRIKAEAAMWAEVVKTAGIRAE
ncbi:MAG: tripartite tricarboxylate transporter substrate binding protein [Betaproteobacteria bacterium]